MPSQRVQSLAETPPKPFVSGVSGREAPPGGSSPRTGFFIRNPNRGLIGSTGNGLWWTLLLAVVVIAVNALSLWGIFTARADARQAAEAELVLQTENHGRSLEAVLDALHGEITFLARSAPLTRYLRAVPDADPLTRRWSRLDAEGSLLLFLESHPAVERLVLRDGQGTARAVVGRRDTAPVLLAPDRVPEPSDDVWSGHFPIGSGLGDLVADISPSWLLQLAAPGLGDRLELLPDGTPEPPPTPDRLTARARFRGDRWQPAPTGLLVRREESSRVLDSVENLAGRFRTALVVNGAIMVLTLLLALIALGQTRRTALLEAAHRHEAERRELERRLFHSERLSSLGRLAAGFAHEINNPLEGMANYLDLLSDDVRHGRTETASRWIERLRQGLDRTAGSVRKVLALADPGTRGRERLDLVPLLRETVEFVRDQEAFRDVHLTTTFPEEPVRIAGDRITLGQLVLNLLLNAAQARRAGGDAEVNVDVSLTTEGELATFRVADRGPGLDPEVRERLFEPFVSTRGSTGLGLAVCHGIALDHGGTIEGSNRPNGGAVFTVRLPLEHREDPEEVP